MKVRIKETGEDFDVKTVRNGEWYVKVGDVEIIEELLPCIESIEPDFETRFRWEQAGRMMATKGYGISDPIKYTDELIKQLKEK